jgi:uncharacterized protein
LSGKYSRKYFRYKSFRDPLYGFISLSENETRLIDTEAFRRLQNIKQLSHAYLVYPSAIHTRFEHSLGCVYLTDRLCSELELDEQKEITRYAALLHDIGHGPLSHLFEGVLEKIDPSLDHEIISRLIINEDSEIDSILKSEKTQVVELLKKERIADWDSSGKSLLSDIVSGGLEADKLDYLRRDSYHIGVAYGQFDLERILHTARRNPRNTRVCVDEKGKDAIEDYKLARYLMHAQVYEHHTRLVADQMFLKAVDIAINDEKIIDKDWFKINTTSSNEEFLKFYKTLDDHSFYDLILKNRNSKASKIILSNIQKRKLLKRACDFTPKKLDPDSKIDLMKMTPAEREKMSLEIALELKLEPYEIIFHKSRINIKLFGEGELLFLDKNGEPMDVSEYSPISADKEVIKYYVFGPVDKPMRKKIAEKIAERLKVPVTSIMSNLS